MLSCYMYVYVTVCIFRMNIFRTGIQRVLCCKSKITHLKLVIITEISQGGREQYFSKTRETGDVLTCQKRGSKISFGTKRRL